MNKLLLIFLFLCINLFSQSRIITLSPSINEIVFALGEGENIVANTQYSNYPEESRSIPKVGGYTNISLEKIIAFNPSIVIAQNYNKKLLHNLKALGINTLVFKTDTISSIKKTITSLGKYFKQDVKAKDLVNTIDNSLILLENIVKNKKILIVIGPRKDLNNQIYIAGNNLYFEDILKASDNKNAYYSKSKNQPVVNSEKIINMNPDIILLLSPFLDGKIEEQKRLKMLWQTLPVNASINKNIYIIAKTYSGIPSHRVIYFIRDFKKILENVRDKQL